jgi:transposase
MTGRRAARLLISDEQRAGLEAMANSPSLPHRAVRQAHGLLDAADGLANEEIGRRRGVSANTVRAWRTAFATRGVAGVGVVAEGRGRKPWLPEGMVAEVVRVTLTEKPADGSTHWSTRTLAKRMGISHGAVATIWRDHGLQPWKVDTFKLSTDPDFEAKLVDVVGLYLEPPAKAAVFCFDEKTQVQALDRTQPSLPMVRGRAGTMTHDYKRHGTTDLFAALNVATGQVIAQCRLGDQALRHKMSTRHATVVGPATGFAAGVTGRGWRRRWGTAEPGRLDTPAGRAGRGGSAATPGG